MKFIMDGITINATYKVTITTENYSTEPSCESFYVDIRMCIVRTDWHRWFDGRKA